MKKLFLLFFSLSFSLSGFSQSAINLNIRSTIAANAAVTTAVNANIIPSLPSLRLWIAARLEVGYADGTARSKVADFSGNGYVLAQATGASQPLYKTGIVNSLPVYRFDGTNDWLQYGSSSIIQNQAGFTFYLVYKRSSGTSTQVPFCIMASSLGAAAVNFILNSPTSASVRVGVRRTSAEAVATSDVTQADNNFHIVACKVDYTLQEMTVYMDGTRQTTVTLTSAGSYENTANAGIGLGGQNSSLYFAGDIGEAIICNVSQSEDTILQVYNYLKGIYGL